MTTYLSTITMMVLITLTLLTLLPTNNTNYSSTVKQMVQISCMITMLPLLYFINQGMEMMITNLSLLSINNFNIKISFILDMYSLTFLPIALFVTWSILEFSLWYMASDPNINLFFKYLLIFLMAMLTLITANNMFQLFIGWEGVGIMSFLLIGWWYSRTNANTAALQAMIYNRIGDIGLIMTIAWLAMNHSNWQIQENMALNTTNIIPMLGLILAAMGKSAQFGLHPWLPAAMEGPTPVSALLHSSTMVVAGVFLLIRLHPLLEKSSTMLTICLCLGATTTMFSAILALTQNDIKKIIAFSTSSQLGLMMVTIGLNQPQLAFIHICTHAFFKAMLFLCSGSIIHSMSDEQDIRKMGGVNNTLPITSSCMTVGNLALAGTPFLAGFYSKDTIIETLNNSHLNAWALSTTILATMLTAAYTTRLIFFTQMNHPRHKNILPMNESAPTLINPIFRLAVASLFMGFLLINMMLPTKPLLLTMPETSKLLAIMATITGLLLAMDISTKTAHLTLKKQNKPYYFSNQLGFFNLLHRTLPTKTLMFGQNTAHHNNDVSWLEKIGPMGFAQKQHPMINLSSYQKGLMKTYMTTFLITTTTFLTILT
uniref:NADH-ubiquinone oxidoreductase chain 5 n=1 Tax=Plica plica TaxID=179265 RepID=C4T8B1_9SAUR|nr:NADH dehydrogenase subunit 5 [Plica plica]